MPEPEKGDVPAPTEAPAAEKKPTWHISLRWQHYLYEFFIVALGISIPFLLDRWNQNIQERQAERQVYENIQREMQEDLQNLRNNIAYNQRVMEQYRYGSFLILEEDRRRLDTLAHIALNLTDISDFHRSNEVYKSLISSGEAKLLRNKKILRQLQDLEEDYIYINRLEENHLTFVLDKMVPQLIEHMQLSPFEVKDPDWFYTFHLNNFLQVSIALGDEKHDIYEITEQTIQHILDLVTEELE